MTDPLDTGDFAFSESENESDSGIGDDVPNDYNPGSLSVYEALHTTSVVLQLFKDQIEEHPAIKHNVESRKLADDISTQMWNLYQYLSERYFYPPAIVPPSVPSVPDDEPNVFDFKTLDIKNLISCDEKKSNFFAVIGSRGTGKSTLLRNIVDANKDLFSQGTVINNAPTMFDGVLAKTNIFYEFDSTIIKDFIDQQKLLRRENTQNSRACIVLDDCMMPKNFRGEEISSLILNGRFWNITTLISMQYPFEITPRNRLSLDGVFIFPNSSSLALKRLWEQYAGVIPEFSQFCEILRNLPEHTALFIDNKKWNAANWKDSVFKYSAN